MPFHLQIYQYIFLKNKDVLSYNHTAVINIRKSAFMYHLIYGRSSDLASCPSCALHRKKKKKNSGPVVFLCHVSFVSFNLRTALQCVLLFHDTDASEERGAFRRLASVWFRLMSPHD